MTPPGVILWARVQSLVFLAKIFWIRNRSLVMDEILRVQPIVRDFTATTLAAIPNAFGRLIYIASLRDLSSGRYEHSGLAVVYPPDAVQEALKFCHQEIFSRVLETPLSVQEQDLSDCFDAMPGPM